MMLTLKDKFIIDSNKEAGKGRFDIVLIPREKGQKGAVLELKRVRASDDKKITEDEIAELLEASAEEACSQIEQKRYSASFTKHNIIEAVHIGVAFYGKNVAVRYCEVAYN